MEYWGNKPMVASEYDEALPNLPDDYNWLIVREVDIDVAADGEKKVWPKVRVVLMHNTGTDLETVKYGRIDVLMYGDGRAVVELAESIYERALG